MLLQNVHFGVHYLTLEVHLIQGSGVLVNLFFELVKLGPVASILLTMNLLI